MNKEDLKKTIKELLQELNSRDQNVDQNDHDTQDTLNTILNEVRKYNVETTTLKQQIKQLSDDNSLLREAVHQQQRYLEMIDAEKRGCNLIITGLPEVSSLKVGDKCADTDEQKVKLVFEKINHSDIIPKQIIRLGKAQQDKIRPIKVILPTSNVRKPILDNTKNL